MGGDYVPFGGICLTDTFALYEPSSHVIGKDSSADNSTRRRKQKKLDIRVIVGNPPYSAGQNSANDNNANVGYPMLDANISNTYARHSTATSTKNLMDSYIRAIRWASDRIGESGVIGYVSNASFVDSSSMDGLRKCLTDEFSSIYVFHLRGNARTSGEQRRREKDNVFGMGTRTPIAISILVKNPQASEHGRIYFHDIGDYLTREEKLARVTEFRSIDGINLLNGWMHVTPDQHNDWIGQRDTGFSKFIAIGNKKSNDVTLFENYSLGVGTNRDAWCYNGSKSQLSDAMRSMIEHYNSEVKRFGLVAGTKDRAVREEMVSAFMDSNPRKISWSSSLVANLVRLKEGAFSSSNLVTGHYRPFSKQWFYYDNMFNHRVGQMRSIFPSSERGNLVIMVNTKHNGHGQIALISDAVPDLHTVGDSQCFPLYLYDDTAAQATDLVAKIDDMFAVIQSKSAVSKPRLAITDAGLERFQAGYLGETLEKEDLFYYVYGLMHSEDYRTRYADNLSKELPRIPAVKKFADFQAFSAAGRKLADLHINYEAVAPYQVDIEGGALLLADFTDADYRVTQMKFASKADKTRMVYNHKITMSGIPLEAYDYVVNGKPALEWVMERQAVTTHKDSGIVNDANLWATETMGDASYPLKLFQRVITVSLETMKLVRGLPRLDSGK